MTPHPAIDALRPPEGVTPGPWLASESSAGWVVMRAPLNDNFPRRCYAAFLAADGDATHIARMDPDTTKALLRVVELLLNALDELAEDECLRFLPDDEPGDCLCAHHWALKRKAEALALLDTITPRDEEAAP